MNNKSFLQFEMNLIDKYIANPMPELAEVLIKGYSFHKINQTKPSLQLESWIAKKSEKALENRLLVASSFGLTGHGSKPRVHLNYITMNACCWELVLKGIDLNIAYSNIAEIFHTDVETVRFGFERRNHDFGIRELCILGAYLIICINKKNISSHENNLISKIADQDITDHIQKDIDHYIAQYKL